MICYSLKCSSGHNFDSWFASAKAYEKLRKSNLLSCSICGDPNVSKAVMAPNVASASEPLSDNSPLTSPASPSEQVVTELKKYIEQNSENVGNNFAKEARAIHNGEAPNRTIHGKTDLKEAKNLSEEGIPVIPLPWGERKTN